MIRVFLFTWLVSCLAAEALSAQPSITAVAASYGPGAIPVNGYSLGYLMSIPTINDRGEVYFRASEYIRGEGYYINAAWMSSPAGQIRPVAHEGTLAVGVEPLEFRGFSYLSGNGAGQAAFFGVLADDDYNPFTDHLGLWATNNQGTLRFLGALDSPAPGTGELFAWPFNSSINSQFIFKTSNLGQVAFTAETREADGNPYYNRGVWAEDALYQLHLIARDNEPVRGYVDGTTFRAIFSNSLNISEHGHVSFLAYTSGPEISGFWKLGIWRQDERSALSPLISAGDSLPGWNSTLYLHDIDHFNTNNRGDAAFVGLARQVPEPLLIGPQTGVWVTNNGGQKTLVAMDGAPVPNMPGVTFRFGSPPVSTYNSLSLLDKAVLLNGRGDIAFMAQLQGIGITEANDTALWVRDADGTFRQLAREGELAPNGALFEAFAPGTTSMSLNGRGQVVFVQGSRSAIWAEDLNRRLVLVAHTGQQIDVDNGPGIDIRTLGSLDLLTGSGGQDGTRSGFNDRGQIAFHSKLDYFSAGIFISNAVAIPEPTGLNLVSALLVLLLCRKAR